MLITRENDLIETFPSQLVLCGFKLCMCQTSLSPLRLVFVHALTVWDRMSCSLWLPHTMHLLSEHLIVQ